MSEVHITESGQFTVLSGLDVARAAAISMDKYMAMMSDSSQDTRGVVPGISAGATVVGAICGVAGLGGNKGTGDEENTRVSVEINNISSYPIVPTGVTTNKCDTKTAPRPIMTGDKTSIEVKASGDRGGFETGDSFALSMYSGLFTELTFERLSEDPLNGFWQISKFYVDGKSFDIEISEGYEQSIKGIAYESENPEIPNFLFYYYPVKKKGQATLCFANYYPQ